MNRIRKIKTAALLWGGLWGLEDLQLPPIKSRMDSEPILIAVIDTGLDIAHPVLKNNLWKNPGETGLDAKGRDRAHNGIDDDKNGYVDDVHGWDFVKGVPRLEDHHGHGTHVTGIILQTAPAAKIMALKYYDRDLNALDTIRFTAEAFAYATKMGARIINYSGGGNTPSSLESKAVQEAGRRNILVVAAAGNESQNADHKPFYPANYSMDHILAVTAHNPGHDLLVTSNYGERSVDLSAPGEDIFSTFPGGGFATMSGTSQATALATGVAALTMSRRDELKTPADLIHHLRLTGIFEEKQTGKTKHSTRLNAMRALALHDREPSRVLNWPDSKLDRQPSSPVNPQTLAEQLASRLSRPRADAIKP